MEEPQCQRRSCVEQDVRAQPFGADCLAAGWQRAKPHEVHCQRRKDYYHRRVVYDLPDVIRLKSLSVLIQVVEHELNRIGYRIYYKKAPTTRKTLQPSSSWLPSFPPAFDAPPLVARMSARVSACVSNNIANMLPHHLSVSRPSAKQLMRNLESGRDFRHSLALSYMRPDAIIRTGV